MTRTNNLALHISTERPWADTASSDIEFVATSEFDVIVRSVHLENSPAQLRYDVSVGSLRFWSRITYNSIPDWSFLGPDPKNSLVLSTLIAWDAMRFLALGGNRITLPSDTPITQELATLWRTCFLKQFGEWRYRNNVVYAENYPILDSTNVITSPTATPLHTDDTQPGRWLTTNGGGKDSLIGMLLLNRSGVPYDTYEGHLPIGGSHTVQQQLLNDLRDTVAPNARNILVTVDDNFYNRPEEQFRAAGITTKYSKTDFAVGHTANYAGLFPLILHHNYSHVWFNIEKSADDYDVIWNDEFISHEWCKSSEYRHIMSSLFRSITGIYSFGGFESTLRSFHETTIYNVVTKFPELLSKTHSCNYDKPWCTKCPKCCFCYLMMATALGEDYAMNMLSTETSLFFDDSVRHVWLSLFRQDEVAWECVASSQECSLALTRLAQHTEIPEFLKPFVISDDAQLDALSKHFEHIDQTLVPHRLVAALEELLHDSATSPSR